MPAAQSLCALYYHTVPGTMNKGDTPITVVFPTQRQTECSVINVTYGKCQFATILPILYMHAGVFLTLFI